ncbi:hypothetical protein GQ43DRAFT_438725 [Delitschia confertaspora ATCC 74209]|uniref:CorA-like protein n=1 Tax=Delitschia confertaspora ATCC 74209 TaxID=1513339 RepID=A0A9P4JUN3_9PLEO|nr:hypothetical protein GQ43DRAFT_438725 [Delitschia confertaspora ATCC 74209]
MGAVTVGEGRWKGEPDGSDGTWLCEKGEYQEYIEVLTGSNPGLKRPDPKNKNHPLKPGNATVVMLEADSSGTPKFKQTTFNDATHLKDQLLTHCGDRRRIYIVEGLAQDYISVMGSHFWMDPTFWLRQERTCVWSNDFTPTSDALPQPSLLEPEKTFHLQFCELRQFATALENKPYYCYRTGRHVGLTSIRENSTTGILRRKISFWSREIEQGGWDVVILCDPPLTDVWANGKKTPNPGNQPYQDGYVDFLPASDRFYYQNKRQDPHYLEDSIKRRSSMLTDLCYHFKHHSDRIPEDAWVKPSAASIFAKKIVAAYYLQLVDYIKAMLPSLELRLQTTGWKEEAEQWRSLQTISRRCGNYSDDVEDTLVTLGYPLIDPKSDDPPDWKNCEKDFHYIYYRLKILKRRVDVLMQAMTGLASIAGNRQNLEEAKRVKRLNLLALLFLPLAYTSSLFSMSDNFKPGAKWFWVYWVSSVPVILITVAATQLMELTLDDAANWNFGRLMLWRKQDETAKKK